MKSTSYRIWLIFFLLAVGATYSLAPATRRWADRAEHEESFPEMRIGGLHKAATDTPPRSRSGEGNGGSQIAQVESTFSPVGYHRLLTTDVDPVRLLSLTSFIHLMHVFGSAVRVPYGDAEHQVLQIVSDETYRERLKLEGWHKTFVQTRYGYRCLTMNRSISAASQPDRQAHEDQLLAVLAEAGVPLDWRLHALAGEFTVRDLLSDSMANFDLSQAEIEWSSIAYAIYLSAGMSLKNKFGRVITFDELVLRLIERERLLLPCEGIHRLTALSLISTRDARETILSESVRSRLRSYVSSFRDSLVRTQHSDGSWAMKRIDPRHAMAGSAQPEVISNGEGFDFLLSTGHKLEWLQTAGLISPTPPDVLKKAREYLAGQLAATTAEQVGYAFCPCSHAIKALLDSNSVDYSRHLVEGD